LKAVVGPDHAASVIGCIVRSYYNRLAFTKGTLQQSIKPIKINKSPTRANGQTNGEVMFFPLNSAVRENKIRFCYSIAHLPTKYS